MSACRFDFSDAHVLVTGGSNGIGHAIAVAFREAGARVTVTGTRADGRYESDLDKMTYRALEMRDKAAIAELAASLARLDVLVNAAGTANPDGGSEHDPDVFEKTLAINLAGTFRVAQAVLPRLKESRGSVLNIASMTSYSAFAPVPGYGASKAAIVQLTKTLAEAWAPFGIRVNALAPGWIRTKLTAPVEAAPGFGDRILAHTPMKRWGEPEDLAGPALFLASPAAGFVTGQTLPVCGGFSVVMM
ncbi:MAG: SDR family oxidoreductase [Alphaproteobacteria bacterium]|nr:SDR family oxidoreductase [Alphaproteobacteria bacterium]